MHHFPEYKNGNTFFPHLHFEIRNSPAYDNLSGWQRDAIHPLHVLPYNSSDEVTIDDKGIVVTNPESDNPVVAVSFETLRVDVVNVTLVIYDEEGGHYSLVKQPGDRMNPLGYNVFPSWFDMDVWNFQYTHKNSNKFPWESFLMDGHNECPYHTDHPTGSYNQNVNAHLDKNEFNGVKINPGDFSSDNQTYSMIVTFNELVGPADCIEAFVFSARGDITRKEWEREAGMCAELW